MDAKIHEAKINHMKKKEPVEIADQSHTEQNNETINQMEQI